MKLKIAISSVVGSVDELCEKIQIRWLVMVAG